MNVDSFTIHSANGVQEGMFVPIGGIKQWIQIRGEDRNNPVLLFIHGGPGGSALALGSAWRSWEKDFTVVQWDQRGAGRTFRESGQTETPDMTISRMTEDGIEVAQFLRAHLHKDKIILVGHSWGSILGVLIIKQHPELFSAYVGTGQVVTASRTEALNYAHAIDQAKTGANEEALVALQNLGPPPYRSPSDIMVRIKWSNILASGSGDAPEPRIDHLPSGLTRTDTDDIMRGMQFTREKLSREMWSVDLLSLGFDFPMPIFFFEATADQYVPIEPAQEYFDRIKAPHKEFVRFEGDHHFVLFNRPDEFLHELLTRVRPMVVTGH